MKRAKRKKSVYPGRQLQKIKRHLKKLLILCCVILIGFIGVKATLFVKDSDYFSIKDITVSGTKVLSKEYITGLLSIEEGFNIFKVDIDNLSRILKNEPWIKKVKVERSLPGTLAIYIEERMPFAILASDETYLLDADGFVIVKPDKGEKSYPVIKGVEKAGYRPGDRAASEKIDRGLLVLRSMRHSGLYQLSDIVAVNVSDTDKIAVKTVYQTTLNLDGNLIEREVARLKTISKILKKEKRRIKQMDLSFKKRVIVKFAKKEVIK